MPRSPPYIAVADALHLPTTGADGLARNGSGYLVAIKPLKHARPSVHRSAHGRCRACTLGQYDDAEKR
jgi:hypothetical protein